MLCHIDWWLHTFSLTHDLRKTAAAVLVSTVLSQHRPPPCCWQQSIDRCHSPVIYSCSSSANLHMFMISTSDVPWNDKSKFSVCLREKDSFSWQANGTSTEELQSFGPCSHFITLTCGLLQEDDDFHSRHWHQIDRRWSFSTQMRAHFLKETLTKGPLHRFSALTL